MDDIIPWLRTRYDDTQRLAEAYLSRRDREGTDRETWAYKLILAEVEAGRAMLDDWQKELDLAATIYDRPDTELHAQQMHPDWEYDTTEGQRKAWDYSNVPPDGEGWERNTDAGIPGEGWERFEYTEESYWRRRRPDGERGRKSPIPRHIRHLAAAFAHETGYRDEWGPR